MLIVSSVDTAKTVLLHQLFERELDNQATLFSERENLIQKLLAVCTSVASIVFCIVAIYMLQAIDPKRLVFRHQLIAFLIFFDLLKATILLLFPARVMANSSSYASKEFCQIVGFFTATATEGADLTILAFAVHTFLLIFVPSLTVRIKGSHRVEGGLYKYRYYIYGTCILIPLALASFPYIGIGYESFVCWCYLAQVPGWYRAVLSWVPRYVILVVIFAVYVLIYVHVLKEFRLLGGAFSLMHHQRLRDIQSAGKETKPSFFSALMFFITDVRAFFCTKLEAQELDKHFKHENVVGFASASSSSNPENSGDERNSNSPGGLTDLENNLGEAQFQSANLESFRKRQKAVEKQLKSIFIYPIAYVSVWFFPFVLHCTQILHESSHGPVVWLNYLGAFMQPFIGFVDSVVFFYREQPWKYTIMRNFEKENKGKLDLLLAPGTNTLDSESTSAKRTKSSLALSMPVDLSQYPKWRRFMSKCRLPLMHLPTEENIVKFQRQYLTRKMEALRVVTQKAEEVVNLGNETQEIDGLQAKHDFSDLLIGGSSVTDFRHTLDSFSLNFQEGSRRHSLSSGNLSGDRRASAASMSNKSAKSHHVSMVDGQDPIPEHGSYVRTSSRASLQIPTRSVQAAEAVHEDEELDFLDFLARGLG